MFGLFRRRGTIIADGLKIMGSVTAEGLVEANGHIEGDLHCTSLVVSPKASFSGGIEADRVVVNGRVEGPIRGGEARARVARSCGRRHPAFLAGDREGRVLRRPLGAQPRVECAQGPAGREARASDRTLRRETPNGREAAPASAA